MSYDMSYDNVCESGSSYISSCMINANKRLKCAAQQQLKIVSKRSCDRTYSSWVPSLTGQSR